MMAHSAASTSSNMVYRGRAASRLTAGMVKSLIFQVVSYMVSHITRKGFPQSEFGGWCGCRECR